MKRKLALSLIFVFTLPLSTPVMSNTAIQKPEKTEKKEYEKKKAEKEKE